MELALIAPGSRVRLHQAFRCCPYAGAMTSRLHAWLTANGCTVSDEADLHIVNTCGSDARQSALTWDTLRAIGARPDQTVVLTGCLVSIDPSGVEAALAPFERTARLGPRHLGAIDGLLDTASNMRFDDVHVTEARYSGNALAHGWTHVVASTGCLGTCSFCAIRRATGRPKSRSIEELLAEVAEAGDVLLVSQDLAAWGTDRGQTVVDLLDAFVAAPGERLLAVESFEPTLFLQHFDRLRPLLTGGRFSFVAVPIQSGSTRVLRTMDRSYDPEAVMAAARVLQDAGVTVRTDILFGFGDESEQEFETSLLASRAFDLPSFNLYQPRPGTPPLALPEAVLRDRRDRALAELHARAQQGVPEIRRTGRPAGVRTEARPAFPWDEAAGRAWITGAVTRFETIHANGWSLHAEVGGDALILVARPTAGSATGALELRVGVRPAHWPGEAAVRTATLALAVHAEGALDPARDAAFKLLVAHTTAWFATEAAADLRSLTGAR